MNLDIRYVAGLFDGEGWITINKWPHPGRDYVRYQLFVGIKMTHYPVIATLKGQFGGMLHRADGEHRKNPKNRIGYAWRLASANAGEFLRTVAPHLVVKRDEALLAIEFQGHVTTNSAVFKYHPERRSELYAYREDVMARLKAMKKIAYDIPNGSDPMLTAVA